MNSSSSSVRGLGGSSSTAGRGECREEEGWFRGEEEGDDEGALGSPMNVRKEILEDDLEDDFEDVLEVSRDEHEDEWRFGDEPSSSGV